MMRWLFAHRTESVQGLFHFGPGDSLDEGPEGVGFLLSNGSTLVLSSGTDWTLSQDEVAAGELPGWCYPPDDWGFRGLPGGPALSSWGTCLHIEEMTNEVGERCGARIAYAAHTITVSAREPFRVRVTRSRRDPAG